MDATPVVASSEPSFLRMFWEELVSMSDANDAEKLWDAVQIVFYLWRKNYRGALIEFSSNIGTALIAAWFRYNRNKVNDPTFVGHFLQAMVVVDSEMPDVIEVLVGQAGEAAVRKIAQRFSAMSADIPAEAVEAVLNGLLKGAHSLRVDGKPLPKEQADKLRDQLFEKVRESLRALQEHFSPR